MTVNSIDVRRAVIGGWIPKLGYSVIRVRARLMTTRTSRLARWSRSRLRILAEEGWQECRDTDHATFCISRQVASAVRIRTCHKSKTYQLSESLFIPFSRYPPDELSLLDIGLPFYITLGCATSWIVIQIMVDIAPERRIGVLPISCGPPDSPVTLETHLVDQRSKLFARLGCSREADGVLYPRRAENLVNDLDMSWDQGKAYLTWRPHKGTLELRARW